VSDEDRHDCNRAQQVEVHGDLFMGRRRHVRHY
jgi:hypothetical protein